MEDMRLMGSSFVGTDMSGTKLVDARMQNSTIAHTSFVGVETTTAQRAGGGGGRSPSARCEQANLAGPCDLSGASIRNSSFRGAFLSGVRLIGVSARGVAVSPRRQMGRDRQRSRASRRGVGVDFGSAYLGLADLKYAELQNTTFRAATVTDARFDHANVSGADFTDSVGLEKAWFGKVVGSPRLGGYSVVIGPGPKWSVSKLTALVGATPTAIPIAG